LKRSDPSTAVLVAEGTPERRFYEVVGGPVGDYIPDQMASHREGPALPGRNTRKWGLEEAPASHVLCNVIQL